MSSTSGTDSAHHCDSNDFLLSRVHEADGSFIIQAHPPKPECNPLRPTDLEFNLSAVLGNNNGKFEWGRTGFHKTGTKFKLCKSSGVLTGELLDLEGNYTQAEINLREKLKVESYCDERNHERHHKLVEIDTLPSRTLILCFDGTSNHFGTKNTNVVKLVELLRKDDPNRQMVYYQTGIGTYAPPGLITAVGQGVASVVDQGVAWYLHQHVIDGYKFLMQTYRAGDRIALFGFSRGAFTARALAGMLQSVGLLPAHNSEHVPFAYEIYKNDRGDPSWEPKWTLSSLWSKPEEVKPKNFKDTFCTPVVIDFVGVWDTVGSVGGLISQDLPWIGHNPSIRVFRQALALDERRGSFIPSVWNHSLTNNTTQDVREVWFRGEHSDVGGGSVPITDKANEHIMLSNISLRWMLRQVIDSNARILFDHEAVHRNGLKDSDKQKGIIEMHPMPRGATKRDWVDRMEESVELDNRDLEVEISDSIGARPLLWGLLEYLPITPKLKYNAEFKTSWTRWPNKMAARSIYCKDPNYPVFIHSSAIDHALRQHEERKSDAYKPRAIWHLQEGSIWPRFEEVLPLKSATEKSLTQQCANLPSNFKLPINLQEASDSGGGWRWRRLTSTLRSTPDLTAGTNPRKPFPPLQRVFRPSPSGFVGGCAFAVSVGLLFSGTVPKSESVTPSS